MTKNVDRNEAEKSLRNKGFRLEKDHDHIFYYHEYRGRETGIKTKFSHSKKMKDIGGEILSSMKKRCCPYLVDISHILLLNMLLVEFTFLQEVSNERDWEMFLPERTLQGFRHTRSRQHCRAWQVRQGQES